MSEEEIRKLAREEMLDTIHNNLDSAMILTYVKGLEDRIDKAIEEIKEDIDYWQDAIYVELKAEDFIKILNNYLEILEGKK